MRRAPLVLFLVLFSARPRVIRLCVHDLHLLILVGDELGGKQVWDCWSHCRSVSVVNRSIEIIFLFDRSRVMDRVLRVVKVQVVFVVFNYF